MADRRASDLRSNLVEGLRACLDAERAIFAALDGGARDEPGPDGGWSAKDTLAHLSAWRQHQADVLLARRQGQPEPAAPAETIDATNEIFHAERAAWTWDRVAADADATAEALMAEVGAASDDTLADPKVVGSIMGDGPEHDLGHLGPIATRTGREAVVLDLADTIGALVDRRGWPARAAAYARYNLACFHALGGRLDTARTLLRQALPVQAELRDFAATDDDLVALRAEIPSLAEG